jgi:DNA repair exonuclease SbcCD ATPase subunit
MPIDNDAILNLTQELDEDEPLFAPARPAAKAVSAPPPLPKKTQNAYANPMPPIPNRSAVIPPTTAPRSGQAPAGPFAIPVLPPMVQRPPGADPFQEPPEPRLPAGSDPDEKLRAFRVVIKGKEDSLARARGLYQAVDQEAQSLRAVATQMQKQLEWATQEINRTADFPQQIQLLKDMLEKDTVRADHAEQKMSELVARLAEIEAERRDLTNALHEVEGQNSELSNAFGEEQRARSATISELEGAKEALDLSQERVSEMLQRLNAAKAEYESLQQGASAFATEAGNLNLEVDRLKNEVQVFQTELENAKADAEAAQDTVQIEQRKVADLQMQLAEALGKSAGIESEQEWAKSSLDQSQARVTEIEEAHQKTKLELNKLSEQLAALEKEKSGAAATYDSQLDALQRQVADSTLRAQSLEEQKQSASNEVTQMQERASQLDSKNKELSEKLKNLEAKSAQLESKAAQAEMRAKDAMGKVTSSSQIESRLKVSEAKVSEYLAKIEAFKALEDDFNASQAQEIELKSRIGELEGELEHLRANPELDVEVPQIDNEESAKLSQEVERLKTENANLKKKLVSAESAIETAASLKSKVARLEAQLKAKT